MFPYTRLCTPTLNEFAGKMDDIGKKDSGFHAGEERLKLRKVSKYTTKALGIYICSLGGVTSA